MRWRLVPGRFAVWALVALAAGAAGAAALGVELGLVARISGALFAALLVLAAFDLALARAAWRRAPLQVQRRLPRAFALGVATPVTVTVINSGEVDRTVSVFDEVDAALTFEGLPAQVTAPAGGRVAVRYTATALRRGAVRFPAVQLRWRTPLRCFELLLRTGEAQESRVYPNFAAVAGYAWLAGDRRLSQIGIKAYRQRGSGTDFRQLSDYRAGDPIRHIDWKATLRRDRPIVREFQDDRDQRVFFLLDCGRRMRADEGTVEAGGSHFDQALNALMLLGYVALKEGDEVGALTFGNPPGQARDFAPRKGVAMLDALMNRLYDIEPTTAHSDYLAAAQSLLRLHPRRAFVIVLTNFRDEDAPELEPALRLLRRRHLVMVASLRERALETLAAQPLDTGVRATEVAAAHLFEQSRRDAFARVTGNDPLSVDVEPAQLAVTLVNRYHAVKRAGML